MTAPNTGAAGVGMPATLHLNAFGRDIAEAFGQTPYLVGSAAVGKEWRDVDVRLMLPDEQFDQLFPEHGKPDRTDGLWSLLCASIAELGRHAPDSRSTSRSNAAATRTPSTAAYGTLSACTFRAATTLSRPRRQTCPRQQPSSARMTPSASSLLPASRATSSAGIRGNRSHDPTGFVHENGQQMFATSGGAKDSNRPQPEAEGR
ncbi:hypothetical protein [Streptomyces sp. NPDC002159]